MDATLLSAIAASSAAVISLVNIAFTARLSHKQDSRKWTRELLPEVAVALEKAFHERFTLLSLTDPSGMPFDRREKLGEPESARASALIGQLRVFASPRTISAAHEVHYALDDMRPTYTSETEPEVPLDMRWVPFWKYTERIYKFLNEVRHEMGLPPAPVPFEIQFHRDFLKKNRIKTRD